MLYKNDLLLSLLLSKKIFKKKNYIPSNVTLNGILAGQRLGSDGGGGYVLPRHSQPVHSDSDHNDNDGAQQGLLLIISFCPVVAATCCMHSGHTLTRQSVVMPESWSIQGYSIHKARG